MSLLKLFGVSSTISVAQVGRAIAKAGMLGEEGLKSMGLGEKSDGAWYLYNTQLLHLAERAL
jgi:hypothetical protein